MSDEYLCESEGYYGTSQYLDTLIDSQELAIQGKLVETVKSLQESYKQQNKNEENQAIEAIRSNPKYFYSYAKRHNNVNTSIGSLEDKIYAYICILIYLSRNLSYY